MEVYMLIMFLHVIGWLYACGMHYENKESVRKLGNEQDKVMCEKGGLFQYAVLFFAWPHFLGSAK